MSCRRGVGKSQSAARRNPSLAEGEELETNILLRDFARFHRSSSANPQMAASSRASCRHISRIGRWRCVPQGGTLAQMRTESPHDRLFGMLGCATSLSRMSEPRRFRLIWRPGCSEGCKCWMTPPPMPIFVSAQQSFREAERRSCRLAFDPGKRAVAAGVPLAWRQRRGVRRVSRQSQLSVS